MGIERTDFEMPLCRKLQTKKFIQFSRRGWLFLRVSNFRAVSSLFRPLNQHRNKSSLSFSFHFRTAISISRVKLFIPLADLDVCL